MRPAVFLDRDGVINEAVVRDGRPYPPQSISEMRILDGVGPALQALRDAGFLNIVVSNQPDVAIGKQSVDVVAAMHRMLLDNLALDSIKVCFHVDSDDCDCRKPKPGMLLVAAQEFDVDLGKSYLVGDRWRDIAAGQAAGCRCIFVDYGYREQRPSRPFVPVNSLVEAREWILSDIMNQLKR